MDSLNGPLATIPPSTWTWIGILTVVGLVFDALMPTRRRKRRRARRVRNDGMLRRMRHAMLVTLTIGLGAAVLSHISSLGPMIMRAAGWFAIAGVATAGLLIGFRKLIRRPPVARDSGAYRTAKTIGDAGEDRVAKILDASGLSHIDDLTLEGEDGATTQIDHLVLVGRSIICLETKTWSGTVSGAAAARMWSVANENGGAKRIGNPIWQNRRHITILREKFGDADVRGLIVMVGSATFTEGMPPQIVAVTNLASRIRAIEGVAGSSPPPLLTAWANLKAYHASDAHRAAASRHHAILSNRIREGRDADDRPTSATSVATTRRSPRKARI